MQPDRIEVSIKTIEKNLKLVENQFSVRDLRKEMNKRKVLGEYHINSVRRIIHAGIKYNLVEKYKNGASRKGEPDIFRKI